MTNREMAKWRQDQAKRRIQRKQAAEAATSEAQMQQPIVIQCIIVRCPSCFGQRTEHPCPKCNSLGLISVLPISEDVARSSVLCEVCDGEGALLRMLAPEEYYSSRAIKCIVCGGEGRIMRAEGSGDE